MASHSNGKHPESEAARRQRLAAALRDNLKRRKAQARARRDGDAGADAPAGDEVPARRPPADAP